jgi:hypothetical protein
MKKIIFISFFIFISCESRKPIAYVPESSGKLNSVTVVMSEKHWKASLGDKVRELMLKPYEGLPVDEPQYDLIYLSPEVFSGFTRQNRNILWFQNDSIKGFRITNNQFAKPQVLINIDFKETDLQKFYFQKNIDLIKNIFNQNEKKEKLRRINKSLSKENNFQNKFRFSIKYPTAYKTVKDTTNFIWLQKQITKGHMNIISYSIPYNSLKNFESNKIIKIRDSIGKIFIPGRLKGSYMITEKAYLPYFYKTKIHDKFSYITKGTWEVENDFMAGPFVNYMIRDSSNFRWIFIEGFTFAPSYKKRDYMFELNTIINTINFKKD